MQKKSLKHYLIKRFSFITKSDGLWLRYWERNSLGPLRLRNGELIGQTLQCDDFHLRVSKSFWGLFRKPTYPVRLPDDMKFLIDHEKSDLFKRGWSFREYTKNLKDVVQLDAHLYTNEMIIMYDDFADYKDEFILTFGNSHDAVQAKLTI